MRFHAAYPLLQLWRASAGLMSARTLSVARLEPTVDNAVGGDALLDLMFSDGEAVAVLPHVRIQGVFLVQRERTPIVWPNAARDLGYETLGELERQLLPWLQSLVLARQANGEVIRIFGDARAQERFDAARRAGFLGAAPYADVLPALGPYVYARRFSAQKTVGVCDARGANGAAMLHAHVAGVRADLCGGERNASARAWFGCDIFAALDEEYDVAIVPAASAVRSRVARLVLDAREPGARHVEVTAAVPTDVMISFDPDDAPAVRTFSVHAERVPSRDPLTYAHAAPAGGSSGRIVMLLRDDFERAADADVDEAQSLASRLRAEGFSVELASPSRIAPAEHPDLVHAFGSADPAVARALVRFRDNGVPAVVTPHAGAARDEASWGPQILAAVSARARDEGLLAEYLDLIALRKLQTEQAAGQTPFAQILHNADVALAATAAEEAQLREAGFRGEIVRYTPKPACAGAQPADIASLVGSAPFAFVHAPVQWRMNLPLFVRAAAPRGIPVVVVGAVADPAALRAATEPAPELVVHAPRLDESEIEALYRSARVYADLSWAPQGLARAARAAASGCRLLLSRHLSAGQLFPAAAQADPGSPESIAAALEAAWEAPEPAPVLLDGPDLFSASIFAYAKAAAARRPA